MLTNNSNSIGLMNLTGMLWQLPHGVALIKGSDKYPEINGQVRFYQTNSGVLVAAEVSGLPQPAGLCESPVFAFHIHSGGSCSGDAQDPFAEVMNHYNPGDCAHPYHAGDLPPLFGNNGYALSICLTDRFTVHEIIGKAVIIHANPDDFTTQPSGNAGEKIACGIVTPVDSAQYWKGQEH